jgi:OmpA-OmpF porin, OOP family
MTHKKKLPPIVYIGATLLAGGICFTGYQVMTEKQSGQPQEVKVYGNTSNKFRVLGDTFSGYSTFRSDAFIEKITKRDLGISYENEFDQKKRAQRLGNGADVIVTTLDQFLLNKPDGHIVGLIDKTVGADAVVLNTKQFPSLKSLNDIKALKAKNPGLKLVYSAGTPSEYLAKLLDIRFEGFKLADFQIVKVEESTEAYKLLQSDPSVAVAVLWEPFVSKAKRDGNTITLSSRDIPDSALIGQKDMCQTEKSRA